MATFQNFVTHLTAAPHVRNVRTSLVLHNSKYEAAVPLEVKARGYRQLFPVIARSASDEAIHSYFVVRWIASRSLSSGAHSRDPLALNDELLRQLFFPIIASTLYGPPPEVAR